ncbi:MAG: hypothetical protein KDD64_05035, partial [Bdellovibrionales bacterium]|nr:hypothetical protein [Bdellovibrionales bacterium]
VTSANDVAVFLWSPDEPQNLRLICREGDVLGEYRIKTLSPAGTDLQVNAVGEIIFSAVVDKTDAAELGKTALFTASLTTPARIFAVQGGSISSDQGSIILSSLKLGSSEALNDSGEVVISAGITSPNPNDEAVIKIRLQDQMQCHADFNGDGIVNVDDLFAFLSAWFAQSMSADFDGSGDIDVPDIFLFLTVWFEGC